MNLTGKQLVEQGIVTGPIDQDNIQQHGVDLNLIKVERVYAGGFVPKSGKTKLAERTVVMPTHYMPEGAEEGVQAWILKPGVYDITFEQGCNIPPNIRAEIYQRSSLLRNGSILRSSVFDAGFKTDRIGTVFVVNEAIIIEVGARVAQFVTDISNTVENLYNGQFQGDSQRKVS